MANKCHYEMKIKGSKESVQTFIRYAEATYYIAGNKIVSDDDRYFFGMEVEEKSEREVEGMTDEVVATIKGYCRWSIHSCLFEGIHTSFSDYQKRCENFRGITLLEASETLGVTVEVYSAETDFMEHFLVKNGELLIEDCFDDYQSIEDEEDGWIETGGVEWNFSF